MVESGLGHARVNQVSADLVFTSRLMSLPTTLAPQHFCIQYGQGDSRDEGHLRAGTNRGTSEIRFFSVRTKATDRRDAEMLVSVLPPPPALSAG